MIYSFYPIADTTLYEAESSKNTGIDSILDLSKRIVGDSVYNNRVLIKFDTNYITSVIDNNAISEPDFYLNLYTAQASELPASYTIEAYQVAEDWDEGTGKYLFSPQDSNGSSWLNKSRAGFNSSSWNTSNLQAGEQASWTSVEGGGVWKASPQGTATYNNSGTDIRIDVTDHVNGWTFGDPNYGFLLKRADTDESSSVRFTELKFFSKDTNTVYLPKLEMMWDDSAYTPGTLQQPDYSKELTVYIKNLKQSYKEASKARFNIGVRERFPTITFATQSNYLQTKQIPTSSFFYSIVSADTNQTIIPFNTSYTKVSCDTTGNYFNLWMDSLQVERYYKVVFRVDTDSNETYIDNNFIFKVTK